MPSQSDLERWNDIKPRLKPIGSLPGLRRVNGIGGALIGRKREIPGSELCFKGYWLTILFVPVIPICFYLVSGGYPEYRFHAKMSIWGVIKTYRWRGPFYLLSAIFDSVIFLVYFILVVGIVYGLVHLLRQSIS